MKRLSKPRDRRRGGRDLNMTPLIDMVFILLIFFLVTTSFVREPGVDVDRPLAKTAEANEKTSLLIGVDRQGLIYIEGQIVDLRSVRIHVQHYLAATPEGGVVVVADKHAQTGVVVQILDECRATGVRNLSLAARKQNQ